MDADAIVAGYQPHPTSMSRSDWDRVRPLVVGFVSATLPCSASSAQQRMRVTGQYLLWCVRSGFGLDPEAIFTEDMVESYFAEADVTDRARATYRSHLRVVAKANTRKAIWTPTPQMRPHVRASTPYTARDVRLFVALVPQQSTPLRRRLLDCVLHLGLGWGLSSSEMLPLEPGHVRRDGNLVIAHVRGRDVPARQEWADGLWRLVSETKTDRILGDRVSQKPALEQLLSGVVIPSYLPSLRAPRLRATWMVDVLNDAGLNFAEFLTVSGLKSARSIEDLVPWIPLRNDYLTRAAGL